MIDVKEQSLICSVFCSKMFRGRLCPERMVTYESKNDPVMIHYYYASLFIDEHTASLCEHFAERTKRERVKFVQ